MLDNTPQKGVIEQFNEGFAGLAKAEIVGDFLEITIGSITLTFGQPDVIGGKSTGPTGS